MIFDLDEIIISKYCPKLSEILKNLTKNQSIELDWFLDIIQPFLKFDIFIVGKIERALKKQECKESIAITREYNVLAYNNCVETFAYKNDDYQVDIDLEFVIEKDIYFVKRIDAMIPYKLAKFYYYYFQELAYQKGYIFRGVLFIFRKKSELLAGFHLKNDNLHSVFYCPKSKNPEVKSQYEKINNKVDIRTISKSEILLTKQAIKNDFDFKESTKCERCIFEDLC